MIRIGVSGFGAMGKHHAKSVANLSSDAVLSAVFSPSLESRKAAFETYPNIHIVESFQELLPYVDAVILTGPHNTHEEQAELALQADKHVLTEKPVGLRVSKVAELIPLAQKSNLVYCAMFNQRALPINITTKNLLAKGEIGTLRRIIVVHTSTYRPQSYFDSASWRATWKYEGGGLLVNQFSHTLDLLTWWAGLPNTVFASIGYGKWHDIEVDDEFSVILSYQNGGTANLIASTADVPGLSIIDLQGDKGKISIDRSNSSLTIFRSDVPEGTFSREFTGGIGSPEVTSEKKHLTSATQGHEEVVRNFIASIKRTERPIAPVSEAIDSLKLTQGIYLSSWRNEPLSFPVDNNRFDEELDRRARKSVPKKAKPIELRFEELWKKNH